MGLQMAVNGVTFHCFFYARIYWYNGEFLHESRLFLVFFAPIIPYIRLIIYKKKQNNKHFSGKYIVLSYIMTTFANINYKIAHYTFFKIILQEARKKHDTPPKKHFSAPLRSSKNPHNPLAYRQQE